MEFVEKFVKIQWTGRGFEPLPEWRCHPQNPFFGVFPFPLFSYKVRASANPISFLETVDRTVNFHEKSPFRLLLIKPKELNQELKQKYVGSLFFY
jgi:hypothetical protein